MNVLITGGCGYLGRHLISALGSEIGVTVVDEKDSNGFSSPTNVDVKTGSILDMGFLKEVFSTKEFYAVVHLAAKKNARESVLYPDLYKSVNLQGTRNVLEVSEGFNVKKFLFASSAAVYGNVNSSLPISEEIECKPVNPYGESKLLAEEYLRSARKCEDLEIIILRLFNLAGYGENTQLVASEENLFPIVANLLVQNQAIKVFGGELLTEDGSCVRDYIHVQDVAQVLIDCINQERNLNNSSPKVFNVGSGIGTSVLRVIAEFEKVSGRTAKTSIMPPIEGDPVVSIGDCSQLHKYLGWAPRPRIEEIVASTWKIVQGVH